MNMYEWSSERFSDYGAGHIIVVAKTVEKARKKALKYYEKHYERETTKQRDEFMSDIAASPTIADVTIIYGSA